jgi:hypothetical protein
MLTPFLVKNYHEPEDDEQVEDEQQESDTVALEEEK